MVAAIYIRVSTLDQAREGYSLAAQQRVITEHCEKVGDSVYKVYSDEGISGKDIKHRPSFQKLIEDAQNGRFDTIYVWALSRFTRSVADLYKTWELLNKHSIRLVSLTEGFDTTTPTGRAMMGVIGVFAQMERELTAERVSLAMKERAEQGKRTCNDVLGYAPDGKDSLKIIEGEAATVRLIFEKFIAYKSYLPVADLLNAMGKHGKRGASFKAQTIRKIVRCHAYIGYYTFHGQYFKGNFPPIIDLNTWNRVQNIVNKISRNKIKEDR